MEIELKLNGKKKKFKSNKITFGTFLKGTEILPAFQKGEFLGDDYEMEQMDDAIELILNFFNNQFTKEEFCDGYEVEDGLDFFALFQQVLLNIQMNNGKRKMLEEAGKRQAQKQD